MKIPLKDGDRVVATFPYRDQFIVITERGEIFRVEVGDDLGRVMDVRVYPL